MSNIHLGLIAGINQDTFATVITGDNELSGVENFYSIPCPVSYLINI